MNVRQSPTSSKTLRNRRRRANKRMNRIDPNNLMVQTSPRMNLSNAVIPQAMGVSTARSNYVMSNLLKGKHTKVTSEGVKFLKCAFSAADFDGSGTYGVPDAYSGKSIAIKHRAVNSEAYGASKDYYYLVLPVPGYAYFLTTVAAGTALTETAVWTGVPYSDYTSLFNATGNASETAAVCEKYRFVSNHFEIVPTTNNTSWTGNIQVFKLPLQVGLEQNSITSDALTIMGLRAVNSNNADMYSGPFNLGCYTGAFNRGASSWDFWPIMKGVGIIPASLQTAVDFGQIKSATGLAIPGFDNNFESCLVKVSGIGTNANNTAILRSWACVEYQFTAGNAMYAMQNLHAIEDEEAMRIYKYVVQNLPVGVSFLDNESFWQRVLQIIKSGGFTLAGIPGPYGAIAGGIGGISAALEQLLF
jgi:hypothetical protein